uniref:Uncharacterized protein n=1 Tax=Arundo donax TaxID=35708 RepID=A0A0A9BLM8_ARUDO
MYPILYFFSKSESRIVPDNYFSILYHILFFFLESDLKRIVAQPFDRLDRWKQIPFICIPT